MFRLLDALYESLFATYGEFRYWLGDLGRCLQGGGA